MERLIMEQQYQQHCPRLSGCHKMYGPVPHSVNDVVLLVIHINTEDLDKRDICASVTRSHLRTGRSHTGL